MSQPPFSGCGIRLLRPKDLQDIFGLSKDTIYSIMKRDTFPAIKIGKQYFVEEFALKEWLARYEGKRYLI